MGTYGMSWYDPRTWFRNHPPAERAVSDLERALISGLTASPTTAGAVITAETALSSSPVFAAVRIISTAVGSLPLTLYRKTNGGREKAESHPAYSLVHDAPNPETDACVWWTAFVVQMLLHGKGAAEIEWGNDGRPRALWLIPGNCIEPDRDKAGNLFFVVRTGSREVPLLPEDVLYVPYFTLDGQYGRGVIDYARECLGLNRAMETGAGAMFANMVRPSGAIEAPAGLSEPARENIRKSIHAQNGGAGKVGRLLFLEDGVKLNPFAVSNQDAQWIEGRQFGIQEVARFFGISPTKLGDLGRATWSNLGSENLSFIENTLRAPLLVPIEQQVRTKLLGRDALYAEYVIEARLRGLTADRYAAYETGIRAGFLLPSEARSMENLPAVPGIDDRPRAGVAATSPEPEPEKPADGNPNADDTAKS